VFNRVSTVLLFATAIPVVAAAQEDCRAIQDPTARLECFDKLHPAPPAGKTAPKNEPVARPPPNTAADGGWQLRRDKDPMTDKATCVVWGTDRPYIQFNIGQMYIVYASRGGLQGYEYRIDDQPASGMQLPSPIEKGVSTINLKGQHDPQRIVGDLLKPGLELAH
jgi:hypothetical protein